MKFRVQGLNFRLVVWAILLLGAVGCVVEVEATPEVSRVDTSIVNPVVATGGGGGWWQVYFTDPHGLNDPDNYGGSIEEQLIERIQNARRAIHLAAFEFDLTPVAEALITAHQHGVEVQWVTDDENGLGVDAEDGHGQFARLSEAGIEVKADGQSALMHNKFIIFDGQTVWTGATNLTVNGIFHNNNNTLVIESPEAAAIFEREFAEMWAGKFGPSSPSTVAQQSLTIEGTLVRIYFAPEDHVVSHLVPLLQQAQKSIRFMAFSFTHDDLGQAMLARAQAGVDVQGIFETRGSETEASELARLYCAAVPVRQDGNPSAFHHKVIVIDGEIVVTGSLNFSENADESNDENVVVLTNTDIAAQYLAEFKTRWAEASAPQPGEVPCH